MSRLSQTVFVACALLLPLTSALGADDTAWSRATQRGEAIAIDPQTQRATITGPDGTSRPLWDGVHRLDDGQTLIIRSGVVVEDVDMSTSRREPMVIHDDAEGVSPCVTLSRRVCGLNGECASNEACALANQLLRFEDEERRERPDLPAQTAPQQCRDALSNPTTFPGCPANASLSEASPCSALLRRVCGKDNQCSSTPACKAAQQLADMEIQERLSAADPELNPRAAGQCTQALLDKDFFLPCR